MGFNIGVGDASVDPEKIPNDAEFLRNHRWIIKELGDVYVEDIVAKELQLPDLQIQKQLILNGQLTYKYAKSVEWQDLQVVFYDNGELLKLLDDWKKLIYSDGSGIKSHGSSGGYKKKCTFCLVSGCGAIVNTIALSGAWPSSISYGRLSYEDTNIKIVTLTLTYDWADIS